MQPEPQAPASPIIDVPKKRVSWIIKCAIQVLIIGVAFEVGYFCRSALPSGPVRVTTPAKIRVYPTSIPSVKITPTPRLSPTPKIERKQTTVDLGTITWLAAPIKIASLQLLRNESVSGIKYTGDIDIKEAKYYQIANLSTGGRMIYVIAPISGPGNSKMVARIIETKDKDYVVQKPQDDWNWQELMDPVLQSSIKVTTQDIPGQEMPETIYTDGLTYTLEAYGYNGMLFSELDNPVKLTESSAGELFQVRTKIFSVKDLYARQIYLKLKDSTVTKYSLKTGLFTDDRKANVTWNDGRTLVSYETIRTGGCGFGVTGVPIIVDNSPLLSGIKEVGITKLGDKVYQIVDPTSEMVKFLYKDGYSASRSDPLSIVEFATKPNHFIWKDPLNDWQIAISEDYALQAECAKPVIYLYPQSRQQVRVKVGAHMRQSDPLYPQDGWKVVAEPSGKIYHQGQEYPYLFWDGLGQGSYPDYHDQGVVVTKPQVEATLRQHLSRLGLNAKETSDFLEFWLPLIPTTPYVRLTWLGTADMNRLAPLTVNPKPDTVIRVFLEFAGLDQYVKLTPQILTAPTRKGFTLVEWGGLLNRK
jgi:hypothetical protein